MPHLRIALLAVTLAACGPKTPSATHAGGGTGSGSGAGGRTTAGQGSGATAGQGSGRVASVPDVGCLTPTCAYHAGGGGYFTCLAGGAGVCFHFGGPCAPADACMFDPADRT